MKLTIRSLCFCPRLITSLLALIFFVLFVSLGFWQLDRAEQKRSLHVFFEKQQAKDAIDLNHDVILIADINKILWRKISATGNFLERQQILLDNQVSTGQAGYYVYTPFKLENSEDVVLVNRGWVSTGNDRNINPRLIMTEGMINIEGVLKEEPRTGLLLMENQIEKLGETITRMQRLTIAEVSAITKIKFLPYIVRLSPESEHGYIRKWRSRDSGENVHIGYAYQWFAFAITLFVIYLVMNIKRKDGVI